MLVFLDTEFTKFNRPDLISIALVSEDGREFYAERTDYRRDECTAFVCETVLVRISAKVIFCEGAAMRTHHKWNSVSTIFMHLNCA